MIVLVSCGCGLCLGALALVALTGDGSEPIEEMLERKRRYEENMNAYNIVGDIWDEEHEEEMIAAAK